MSNPKVGVVGTGIMATGTIVLLICNRYPAVMLGRTQASCERGLAAVNESISELIAQGYMTEAHRQQALTYLTITQSYTDLADCAVLFECALEDLAVKREVMEHLEASCSSDALIGSTTSAISANEIASFLAHKARFMVTHSWNPPHLVPLVEIVKSKNTSPQAVEAMVSLLEDLGRVPVVLKKDAPGFIGNRLHCALHREALHILEEGIASPEDIDKALMYSMAPRYTSIGLLEYFDASKPGMLYQVQKYLFPDLCNATQPMETTRTRAEDGSHIFDWSKKDAADYEARKKRPFYPYVTLKITDPLP